MDHLGLNRSAWDERTRIHVDSSFYDVPGFLAGETSLREIELERIGDVTGKRLLHLQCHFGLDTLSLARMGAQVTGVDLSPASIEMARELTTRCGVEAEFEIADVLDYRHEDGAVFDLVFTTYGTVIWLPDISAWAQTIVRHLKPGGVLHFVDFHPLHDFLEGYPYFHDGKAIVEEEGTYTENDDGTKSTVVTWAWPVSAVMSALIEAGLVIERLDEFPYAPWNCFANLEEREPGRFFMTGQKNDPPLVYAIQGRMPA